MSYGSAADSYVIERDGRYFTMWGWAQEMERGLRFPRRDDAERFMQNRPDLAGAVIEPHDFNDEITPGVQTDYDPFGLGRMR